MSLKIVGFSLAVAEGGGVGGDASSSSSSSVASPSSSSLAAVVQPLSLGLIGPSSSTQSPSSPWRSAPGPEPSTPSSPATENRTIVSVRRDSGLDGERGAVTPRLRRQSLNQGGRKGRSTRLVTTPRRSHREFGEREKRALEKDAKRRTARTVGARQYRYRLIYRPFAATTT